VIPLYAKLASLTYLVGVPPGVLGVTFDTSFREDGSPIVRIGLAEDSTFDVRSVLECGAGGRVAASHPRRSRHPEGPGPHRPGAAQARP
jgi:hypothetical protein